MSDSINKPTDTNEYPVTIRVNSKTLFRLEQIRNHLGQTAEQYVFNALLDALRRDGLLKGIE